MKTLDRRDFLKKATLASASALTVPTLFNGCIYNHRTTKTNQKYPSVNL